jgi:hypothetical protein
MDDVYWRFEKRLGKARTAAEEDSISREWGRELLRLHVEGEPPGVGLDWRPVPLAPDWLEAYGTGLDADGREIPDNDIPVGPGSTFVRRDGEVFMLSGYHHLYVDVYAVLEEMGKTASAREIYLEIDRRAGSE